MSIQRIARDVAELAARSVLENLSGLRDEERPDVFELVRHHTLVAVESYEIMVRREQRRIKPSDN